MKFQPKCDGPTCSEKPVYECGCARCQREPDWSERYHSCREHLSDVAKKHERVRGREFEPFDF